MSKRQMIELLLEAYDYAVSEGDFEQVNFWMSRVTSGLLGAGMAEEHKAWLSALESTSFYSSTYSTDHSLIAHTLSMKAILIGILDKVKETEPSEELFPMEIVVGTRNYIERIAAQANSCYQQGYYDACAVMIRRLIEILIVDCFEQHGMASKIKEKDDRYYSLANLIDLFLTEPTWHVPPHLRKYLPQLKELKEIGDAAAHGRNIIKKAVVDKLSKSIFYTFQGLIHIADYK